MYIKKITLIMAFILLYSNLDTAYSKDKDALHCLNIKKVITDNNVRDNSEYEYGKLIYPQYERYGLPENFMIKKTPDVVFRPDEIKSIKIKNQPFIRLSYVVTINLEPSGQKKIDAYAKKNINSLVALEIDNNIIVMPKITGEIDTMQTTLQFTIGNKTIQEIEMELRKISKDIVIETNSIKLK